MTQSGHVMRTSNRSRKATAVGFVALLAPATVSPASSPAGYDTAAVELPPQITLASKTVRPYASVPVPASVVTAREMRTAGAVTLGDVLAEQTGLAIVHNHGTGVQMQGLAPDYTLILVDGEPAIGRRAGTLDLDRFMIDGLDQVEIVKGPSSSLYGSDALGGTINLVTRRPNKPLATSLYSRAGMREGAEINILQTGGSLEARQGAVAFSLFADRATSEGYDLSPEARSQTAPQYQAYTLQPKATYAYADGSRLTLSSRYFLEKQQDDNIFAPAGDTLPTRSRSRLNDAGITTSWEHRLSEHLEFTAKGYATNYRTASSMRIDSAGVSNHDSMVTSAVFDQRYYKAESFLKTTVTAAGEHTVLAGSGGIFESVKADRIEGGVRNAHGGFAFLQDEWSPVPHINLQASGRVDAHRDYATNFGPRLAGLIRPVPWLALRATAGKGFKAPTSQELYMDFTNASVGYSVFGSSGAKDAVQALDAQGQIAEILLPLESHELKPEKSWSYNAGAEVTFDEKRLPFGDALTLKANIFRNNVSDLIDSRPVALKINGQHVYTYFNLDRIHTQGLETETSYRPWNWLTLEGGHQYLSAQDNNVLERIRRGEISKVGSTGVVRPVQRVEYGGLFNRSRHSGNVKATWQRRLTADAEATASLRVLIRGRYGYADRNGNGILDSDNEYEAGYTLWNISGSVTLYRSLSLDARVDNLLDEVRPLVPLPGRLIYAGIRLQSF